VKHKTQGLVVALIACGASLIVSTPALASSSGNPGDCHLMHHSLNAHIGWWETDCLIQEVAGTSGIPVHVSTRGGSTIVGHLSAGWRPFYWQQEGNLSIVAHRSDWIWARTIASNGQPGYVNELWFSPGPLGCFDEGADLPWHGYQPFPVCG
jgi:hypothetical protein